MISCVPHHALCPPLHIAGPASLPIVSAGGFLHAVYQVQTSHALAYKQ